MAIDWKNYAIGTLTVALLISLGINISPNSNYLCRTTNEFKYCDHLSMTGKTCYPLQDSRVGSTYCSDGWDKVNIVAEQKELNIPTQYICKVDGTCNEVLRDGN